MFFNSLCRLRVKLHSSEAKGPMRNEALSGHSRRAWRAGTPCFISYWLPFQVITHTGKPPSLLSRVGGVTSCPGQGGGIWVKNGWLYYCRTLPDSSHSTGNADRSPRSQTGLLMGVSLIKDLFYVYLRNWYFKSHHIEILRGIILLKMRLIVYSVCFLFL